MKAVKKITIAIAILGTLASVAPNVVYAGAFTAGNLVVERVGDGTQTLTANGNTIFFDEYTTSGTLVQSIQIPSTGTVNEMVESGTATSDGTISLSPDGQLLAFPGYNTNLSNASSVTSATSTKVPRAAGTLNAAGTYTLAATSTGFDSGNNIRDAATDNKGNYWCSGNGSGIAYFGSNTTAAAVYSTVSNLRCMNIFGTNIWFDDASGTTTRGIWEFTNGTPTTAATPTLIIQVGAANDSPYGFSINNSANPTVIYYADDGSQGTGNGGIHKWTNNGTAWISNSIVILPGTNVFGLVVDWTTTPATIYATTSTGVSNLLIKVQDNGASSVCTILSTATTNQFYRGVAFAPHSPPVANSATYTRNVGTPLLIGVASDLLANYTTDPNGLTVYLTSVGTPTNGTAIISSDGNWILYTPTNINSASGDFFTYTVNDGRGGSASSTLTVNVAANTSTGSAGTVNAANYPTSVNVTMYGIPNYYYDVQRATDAAFTQNVTTIVTAQQASSSGLVSFTDNSPPSPSAFYRLKYNHQ